MALIIESIETGEQRVIEPCPKHKDNYHVPRGWKAIDTVHNVRVKAARAAAAEQDKPTTIH